MAFFGVDIPSDTFITSNLPGGVANDVYALAAAPAGFRPFGSFVISGFQTGPNGDQIYLNTFLHSVAPSFDVQLALDPFTSQYLRLVESGDDTIVQFDPSGLGVWSDLVTLKGVEGYTLAWSNFPDISPNGVYNAPSYAGVGMRALPSVTGPAPLQQALPLGTSVSVNLIGGDGPDLLVGSRGNDTFHGGGGSDRIFQGGGGIDTATYDGPLRSYHLNAGIGILQISGGPEGGTDTLAYIARAKFVDGYLTTSVFDTAAQVYRLYWATLARAPDHAGLVNWTSALNSGALLGDVAAGFVNSAEFQATYGSLDNTAFVTLLYHNVLHRAPDPAGLTDWVSSLNYQSRAKVVVGFSESPEYVSDLAAPVQQGLWIQDAAAAEVARLYDAVFGRLPDASGLANWTHVLESGTNLQTVANGFVGSTEFQAKYGNLDNAAFVTLLYHNVLHRAPDQAGLDNWVGDLNGGMSRAEVVTGFSESPEHITNTAAHVDYGIWLAG